MRGRSFRPSFLFSFLFKKEWEIEMKGEFLSFYFLFGEKRKKEEKFLLSSFCLVTENRRKKELLFRTLYEQKSEPWKA